MVNNAFTERWTVKCAGGLTGGTIHIAGLTATMTDVLVRLERLDGTTQVTRLTPSAPSFVVEAAPRALEVARTYVVLGVEHILTGIDHLLFVLALLIITRGGWKLVKTVTAFTISHSITLSAATLGFVHVPQPPVEAVIALSIVFVAAEIVRMHRGVEGITARAPWIVAFTFGLMHGLGFAGGLSEAGLPAGHIPTALLFFSARRRGRPFPVHRRGAVVDRAGASHRAFRFRAGPNSSRPTPSAPSPCSGSSNALQLFEHINERKDTTMQTTRTQHLIATALAGALAVIPSIAQTAEVVEARLLPRGCRREAPSRAVRSLSFKVHGPL